MDRKVAIDIASQIPGWMEPEDMEAIAKIAERSYNVCEVGCLQGRTTKLLALLCKGTVSACDWFNPNFYESKPDYKALFDVNLAEELASGKVRVYQTCSANAATLLRDSGATFDFIFIDADHDYEHVKADIAVYLPLVKPGGIIGGHDFNDSEPSMELVRAVTEAFGDRIRVEGVSWFVEVA